MEKILQLSKDETLFLCEIITADNIRKHFQKYPKQFNRIVPGFRSNKLSDKKTFELVYDHISEPFIHTLLDNFSKPMIKEIDESTEIHKQSDPEITSDMAVMKAVANSPFAGMPELYFKLSGADYSDTYIALACSTVRMITEQESSRTEMEKAQQFRQEHDANVQRIAELEHALHIAEQSVQDLQSAHSQVLQDFELVSAKNVSLQEELQKLRNPRIGVTSNLTRNPDYPYMSLCKVYYGVYDGKPWLDRLADITDQGELIPFENDSSLRNQYEGLSSLFYRDGPKENIGVWEWNWSYNDAEKIYTETHYLEKYEPTEIVVFSECQTEDELLDMLKTGFSDNTFGKSKLYAIVAQDGRYIGYCCNSKNTERFGNQIRLKKDRFTIEKYIIPANCTVKLGDRIFYQNLTLGECSELVRLFDAYKAARDILVSRLTWSVFKTKGFQKSQWQKCKGFLEEMPTQELYAEIAETCQCTEEEAVHYVEEIMSNADLYFSDTTLESDLLASVIASHPDLMHQCQLQIEEKWKQQHEEMIKSAASDLCKLKEQISSSTEKQKQIQDEYLDTEKKLTSFREEIAQKEALAKSVEEKVASRIAAARQDASDLLCDMAFIPSVSVGVSENHSVLVSGKVLDPEDLEMNLTANDVIVTLSYELQEAGVASEYANSFAGFLYAAYLNHVPIILAGPNGQSIADALSASLFGKLAARMNCAGTCPNDLLEQLDNCNDSVVTFSNAFRHDWLTSIAEQLDKMRCYPILIHPFADDLCLESQGLYHYCLPVLTELLVDKKPTGKFVGGYFSESFVPYKSGDSKSVQYHAIKTLQLGMLAKNRLQRILTDMHCLLENESNDDDYLYGIVPYAYMTGKMELLVDIITQTTQTEQHPSADTKAQIRNLAGVL